MCGWKHNKTFTISAAAGGTTVCLLHTPYLEVFGDGGLSVVLHLSELCPQALHLVLHLHDVLKVPLSSQVQHLNGLGHVLHL